MCRYLFDLLNLLLSEVTDMVVLEDDFVDDFVALWRSVYTYRL